MTDPFLLDEAAAVAWCEAEGVSWAGLRCLRLAVSQTSSYRWDPALRVYVRSRVDEPDAVIEHDFVERHLAMKPRPQAAPVVAAPEAIAPVALALALAPAAPPAPRRRQPARPAPARDDVADLFAPRGAAQ